MKLRLIALNESGFTLIELMITVAILALLASIALPAYQGSITKSRRTEARTALLDIAGREERLFSTNNVYSNNPFDVGYSGTAGQPFTVGGGYYQVTISTPTTASFTLTATAIGNQAADTQCASFTVDQTGNQQATTSSCWQR